MKQDIERLGKAGNVIKVKDGFARNFLIPNGLAVYKTQANLKMLEQEKQKQILKLEKAKKEASELSERLKGLSLTIPTLAYEEDKLYGSISVSDIATALKEEGFAIEENSIILDESIKTLGIYEIPVKLHPEVSCTIKVWVVKK